MLHLGGISVGNVCPGATALQRFCPKANLEIQLSVSCP